MSKRAETIRCIYCKEFKPRPSRGEHIILSALGGRTTISDVCANCNHNFGRDVDQPFLQKSLIGYYRLICPTVTTGGASSPQFVPSPYGTVDARLLNDGGIEIPPQVALIPGGPALVAYDRDRQYVENTLSAFASETPPLVHREIRNVSQHEPTRIVFDRSGRSHLLRARTEEDADELCRQLRARIAFPELKPWTLPATVMHQSELDLNATGRCVAKMAFNAACVIVEPVVLLTEWLDPIRNYIRGLDVIGGTTVDENGEHGVLVDYRFVDRWLDRKTRNETPRQANWHSIELRNCSRELCATVQLYGGYFEFNVHLGLFPSWCADRVPIRFTSQSDGDWWQLLESAEPPWQSNSVPPWGR